MRICDDIDDFTKSYLTVMEDLTEQTLRIIGASYIVYTISPSLIAGLWGYAITGVVLIVFCLAKKLAQFKNLMIIGTANFRGGLIRSRENAEAIAFYKAGSHTFVVVEYLYGLAKWESFLKLADSMMRYITWIAPTILLADPFLKSCLKTPEELENSRSQKMSYGTIQKAQKSFVGVMLGLTILSRNLSDIGQMGAACHRIWDVILQFDEEDRKRGREPEPLAIKSSPPSEQAVNIDVEMNSHSAKTTAVRTMNDEKMLALHNVTLSTPDNANILVRDLSVTVSGGESLLIVGPSGIGKSSLLRAVCGLWQAQSGQISLPSSETMMFLPQNAYIPELPLESNTLQAQLLFPRVFATHTEAEYVEALRKVNLTKLLGRKGTLSCDDWRKRLSNGEKQRLAMARLILARPVMAFLDEATSALDPKNEQLLYQILSNQESTFISVGHKRELLKYHTHVLELSPGGRWRLCRTENFSFHGSEAGVSG